MDIFLIRHTAVEVPAGTCYGHADVPLAANCRKHFNLLQQKLPSLDNPLVLSSPASRCLQLAQSLSARVETDERLRELHFGRWENRLWKDVPEAELTPWMADYVKTGPPEGESYQQLYERAVACWKEKMEEADSGPLLVVTHAGVIRSLLAYLLELSLENTFKLQIDYGSICRLSLTKGYLQIAYVNR